MFKNIFAFEIKYRIVRPATYVYFGIFFLLAFLGTVSDAIQFGGPAGNTFRNSPLIIANIMGILTAFGMLVTSAIMSTPVYRDFEHNTHHLFFTLPMSKGSYLGGRFLGSFVIAVFVFAGIPLGIMLGSFIGPMFGWIEPDKAGPFNLMAYVQPFVTIVIPNILFSGAIFFALASLTRKIVYTYLGNVILLVIYIWGVDQLGDLDNKTLASILDPFALSTIGQITRYWTPAETNIQLIPVTGILFLNRVLWILAGIVLFLVTLWKFSFTSILEGRKRKSENENLEIEEVTGYKTSEQVFSLRSSFRQLIKLAILNFKNVVKEIPFVAIVFCGVVLLFTTASVLQGIYGTSIYPVTYALLEQTSGSFALFVIIIITFYSGELVWQERRLNMNLIYDALPVPNWLLLASKMLALTFVLVLLMGIVMISSILIQLFSGFTNIDFALYIKELFYLKLYGYILISVLAVLIQTLVREKFLGHLIMVVYFIWNIVMGQIGLEHNLYHFNGKPSYVYSEINKYGHLLEGVNWMNLYWGAFALLLAVLANLFWQRGTETGFSWKLKIAGSRFNTSIKIVTAMAVVAFIALGSFIFYNTNVLNTYRTKKEGEKLSAEYEKKYKKYERIAQPKITSVNINVDIFPSELKVRSAGVLKLKNRSNREIDSVILDWPSETKVNKLDFAGYSNLVFQDSLQGFHIYKLKTSLLPGDSINLNFDFVLQSRGFQNGMSNTAVVYNGSFINNQLLSPSIGYNPDAELSDRAKRRKNGLKPKERMASVNDSVARMNTYIARDGDWIDFEATVSTSSDQIAIAPGYLQKEWTQGDRKYFSYKMDSKILNFYSFLSARYAVKRDKWKDLSSGKEVNLEIYYNPGHAYNLDKMMKGMKASLSYYTKNFSPYQHKQVRIIEFPRYASFAQSFPNTIPFSESIGFMANLKDEKDIDYVYYVTAHEVAHQWWAHQVIGGNVQGSTLMSETMSQYSALMVMEKQYGKDQMRKFLKYELDKYLQGRALEDKKELPVVLCEDQQYIHYNKGSVVMYALKDYIGEENVNKAMAEYIQYAGFQKAPFTNSIEFLGFIKKHTPDSLQYVVKDMFETITLYSNKTDDVSYSKMADGKYKVKIKIDSHKFRADSLGKEKEIAFNDYIDIGVIGEENKNGKAVDKTLYLQKYKVKKGINEFEIIVKEEPKKAGVDIYNKLIDRDSDDNLKKANLAS